MQRGLSLDLRREVLYCKIKHPQSLSRCHSQLGSLSSSCGIRMYVPRFFPLLQSVAFNIREVS